MKTHLATISGSFIVMMLMTLPALAEPAESAVEQDAQRAACDARCREDYQSNAAALQACLRDCGAIGPATAGAVAAGHEATHTAQQAGAATGSPIPAEAVNLNSSRSNVYRSADVEAQPAAAGTIKTTKSNTFKNQAEPGTGDTTPVEATTVKSSKSNSQESTTVKASKSNTSDSAPAPQATTVKGSKSNSDNRSATPPPPPVEASNLNLSKSNINREVETEASGATPPEESEDDAPADR